MFIARPNANIDDIYVIISIVKYDDIKLNIVISFILYFIFNGIFMLNIITNIIKDKYPNGYMK